MKTLSEMREVKKARETELLERPGVTGVDIGYKYVDGKKTDERVIRVYVEEKKPKEDVPKDELIPKTIKGVKTDVIERKFVLHPLRMRLADLEIKADTGTYDPLKGGISIGPCRVVDGHIYVGTLGAIVEDNDSGDHMLLSNFHVMCVDDAWSEGDTMAQPSRVDGGSCPADVVGELQRASLGGRVDCAVASHTERDAVCEIVEIGDVTGTATAEVDMAVRKRGRTTGLTYGMVESVDLSVRIDYEDGLGVVTLTDQIGIEVDPERSAQFGDNGDSGAVVVNEDGEVVGLYFAGDETGEHGAANPIQAVLDALDVSICVSKLKKFEPDVFKKREPDVFKKREPDVYKKYEPDHFKKSETKEVKEKEKDKEKDYKEKEKEKEKEFKEYKEIAEVALPPTPFPGMPRAALEERLARLEAAVAQVSPFRPAAEERRCIDFKAYRPTSVPNPWTVQGVDFHAFDHAGNPWPDPGIYNWGAFTGLQCGYRLEIKLSEPCRAVEVTLAHFSSPASIEAYNADGSFAGSASMSGPGGVAETLTVSGASITHVVVVAPNNETLLLQFCCVGEPEKPREEERRCIDFRRYKPMKLPNPWTVDGLSLYALDHAGNPWPHPGIHSWGAFTGLQCGYRLEIKLPGPCRAVEVTLVHFSSPAKIAAYNADGSFAGSAAMSGPGGVAETLTVSGTSITHVVVVAPNDETLLLRFCCIGPPKEKEKREPDVIKKYEPDVVKKREPEVIKKSEPEYSPLQPGAAGSFEERVARLESAMAQMTHFIRPELRPDMGGAALRYETDLR